MAVEGETGSRANFRSELDELREGLRARQFAVVLARAETLLPLHAGHAGLLSIAASASYSLGRYGAARGYLERALQVQPDSQALRDSLARVMKRLEDS